MTKIEELRSLNHEDPVFIKWHDDANRKLREFYGEHEYVTEFENIEFSDLIFRTEGRIYSSDRKLFENGLSKGENVLKRFIELEKQYSQERDEE